MAKAPVHEVEVGDFLLGKHEVTVGRVWPFCRRHRTQDRGGDTPPESQANRGFLKDGKQFYPSWRAHWFNQTPEHPAVLIAWEDAIPYCNWLSRQRQASARLRRGDRGSC